MDVKTYFFDLTAGGADWLIAGGFLSSDDGLATAVILSLFTDQFAGASDSLPHNQTDRRGWWADAFASDRGDKIGSKLWLVPAKQLQENIELARQYAEDALFWLLEDGVAEQVTVEGSNPRDGVLQLVIQITKPDGQQLAIRFESLWGNT